MNDSKSFLTLLSEIGINPFGAVMVAESVLKSPVAKLTVNAPKEVFIPINRTDCAGWRGVRIWIEAVPENTGVDAQENTNG